jgi:hypothetical protein
VDYQHVTSFGHFPKVMDPVSACVRGHYPH